MPPLTAPGAARADRLPQALAALRKAARDLSPLLSSDRQRDALADIEAAIARLDAASAAPVDLPAAGLAEFDAARLNHLLQLTGPDLAQELLARLTEDLTATLRNLDQGAAETDWKRLREGSHVLISLAGSVGALSLQASAETLNAIAHAQDQASLQAILPGLRGELQALIALVPVFRTQGPSRR